MIAIEKLLILRAVTLFKQMPDDLLLQLVLTIVKEEFIEAGKTIIDTKVKNSYIYIIVSGCVKIHTKDHFISELGEREVFGELSALSFEFPISYVSAVTDCLVLKISSQSLYDVMYYDIGIAKGIIAALCHRAQAISTQLQHKM